MSKGRLEAFSDGVLAIVITIMVLEIKVPHAPGGPEGHAADLSALRGLLPMFVAYVLSFLYLAIYWNNHHHMLHVTRRVSGGVLWANLHLLFWLSLIPFTTGWMGQNAGEPVPAALYGVVLLCAGFAYRVLQRAILHVEGSDSELAAAVGRDRKGLLSIVLYALALPLAFVSAWVSYALYLAVALVWIVPDRRIERRLHD